MRNFKMIALTAIAIVAMTACQSDEDVLTPEPQAQEVALPQTITIVSAEKMPESIMTKAAINVTAFDVAGDYNGVLYDVNMNGKLKDDAEDVVIRIVAENNDTFTFVIDPFKIGNMPGELSTTISRVHLNSNGTFHEENKGRLDIETPIPVHPRVTLLEGNFTPVTGGYKINLTLESEGSIFNISIFKAHVKYEGEQQ